MIQEGIRLAARGMDLDSEMAQGIMDEMMAGIATPSQMASFLTAMRIKGETKDELLGLARSMRAKAVRVTAPDGAIDLCGTGGDGTNTFNISTAASFVAAACGAPVAKHGNRAISSRSGSADVLSAMGIPVMLDRRGVERCIEETGIGFMFAPQYHESMRNVMATRREIGIRTFFNILGPMANPAFVKRQLVGVYDPSMTRVIAEVLMDLGSEHAMVVHGSGTDEIAGFGPTRVVEAKGGSFREYDIAPQDFGLEPSHPRDVAGGSAQDNARTMYSILKGEISPRTDVVAMNAGAALVVAGKASSLREGFEMANEAISSGAALNRLESFSNACCALETESQLAAEAAGLRGRRILPDTLKARAAEITNDLMERISDDEEGRGYLKDLDPALVDNPSVLSVLALNRMAGIISAPRDMPSDHPRRSGTRFSDSIRKARGLAVVGEYKPRSPSTKGLHISPDPVRTVRAYANAGVASVSVLAEEDFFGGGEGLFARVRAETHLPMLFKDFVTTERQIRIAKAAGADAVLLIAKALRRETLERFVRMTLGLGLEPLVEVHDEIDLEKVYSCSNNDEIGMIGINGRDLRTLDVSVERAKKLRALVADDRLVIAESGMRLPADVKGLTGFDAVLIGSMFMRAEKLEATVAATVDFASGVTS
jgi:anthranilate phosphoribosyltransferase